ncbi:NYN domain-containing protein [Magnetospirillum sp. UT-4]|uniref:NYN domain-containing protein n=1 Tax=Magnetospirillum sp. UT-4 TaxID=2681467 RepID=UPI0013851C2C|nr:NYN domain-containing protein [Magnetospirillum sp. UT-4]CAA7616379.1 conserved hypothetical protein [Magnetospirillum sp. UT-4]
MEKERVICFVDGFNLYHAIDGLGRPHLKWVDLMGLARCFIGTRSQQLDDLFYFSAYATWRPDSAKRHRAYVAAIQAMGATPVMGHFKDKTRWCPACKNRSVGHEEKETDVNIALALLDQAYRDLYDHAFLVTGDSDIAPAVRLVLSHFPNKKITVIAPPHRPHSSELIQAATTKAKITPAHVERCLMPRIITDAGGNLVATRPVEYDPPA